MAKKRKRKQQEIPAWVVTFGDMMALLLVFFILLFMFSELKRDHEYQRVITAVREAFGYSGGVGVLPIDDPPLRSVVEQLEDLAMKQYEDTKISQSDIEGVDGPQMRVTKVREGIVFTIGGPATFEESSAEIMPAAKNEIRKLATLLAGRNNKIIVRGHAARKYLSSDSQWKDLDELSYTRASNVMAFLQELGIEDWVFRMEVAGVREPVRPRASSPADIRQNRRVEIILTEQLVEEMDTDWLGTDPNLARDG